MKSKKELKEAYRQMKFRAGLYQIRNVSTDRKYIDVNTNLDAIWNRHRTELKFGSHQNGSLQHDWNQNGESKFIFEILELLDTDALTSVQITSELKLLKDMYLQSIDIYKLYN